MRRIDRLLPMPGSPNVIALSNDGIAYVGDSSKASYAEPSSFWTQLPSLPQEGFKHPMEVDFERVKQLLPGLGEELSKLTLFMSGHRHVTQVVGIPCFAPGCDFQGTQEEVVAHVQEKHPDLLKDEPDEKD